MNAYFELLGNQQTLAGIVDSSGRGIIENAEQQSGISSNGTLTINNTANCTYGGYIRNGDFAANAASTGLLALVKSGPGTLTLIGWNCSDYTGGLTVNAGTLDYSGAGMLPGTPIAYPTGPTGPTSPAVNQPLSLHDQRRHAEHRRAFRVDRSVSDQRRHADRHGHAEQQRRLRRSRRPGRRQPGRQRSIGVTKSGPTTAVLNGMNSYTGCTTVTGGTLDTRRAQNCVLNVGGADIQSGSLVFDYAAGADPIATIQSLLKASYDGGHWDVGQFRDSTAAATGLTLGCVDNTATDQVKVMATYPGDFNLDGVVDSRDYAIWAGNVFTGSTWQQGDANYDGVVNGLDRDFWFSHLGLPPLAAAHARRRRHRRAGAGHLRSASSRPDRLADVRLAAEKARGVGIDADRAFAALLGDVRVILLDFHAKAAGDVRLNGSIVDVDSPTGHATAIRRICIDEAAAKRLERS